jgi:aryl-alcohol dehydrogenase-like predicted oxidoreductase
MKMEKIYLGSSDLEVSKICLGTMTFGEQNNEAQGHAQLDYALERGINFIDTAEMYPVMPRSETTGATERIIGTWLKKSGKRQDVVLATKIAGPSKAMTWVRNGQNNFDEKNIREAVEGSLRRLQTDYIDLYQLHWPSRNVPIFGQLFFNPDQERPAISIEETLGVLYDLIEEGKIRYIGVSNESAWGISEYVYLAQTEELPRIVSIQNCYHLANRSFESGLDESCYREDIGLLAYSPLAFGQLTGKYINDPQAKGRLSIFPPNWSPRYLRPRVIEATKRYMELAKAHNMTVTELSLAWCYTRWFVASTIIGATNLDHLKANIDAYSIKLSDEVVKAINAIHAEFTNPGQ